jgi:hypothetical protein
MVKTTRFGLYIRLALDTDLRIVNVRTDCGCCLHPRKPFVMKLLND